MTFCEPLIFFKGLFLLTVIFDKGIVGKRGAEAEAAGEALQIGDAQKGVISIHEIQKQTFAMK